MNTNLLSKKRRIDLALKILLTAILAAAIWYDFRSRDNLPEIWATFLQNFSNEKIIWFAAALALVPFNWLAETQKWHQFVHRYDPRMDYWRSVRAVLAGVTFSIFTPNRVGEYGGRILFVKPKHRWKAVFANIVGNFAQFLVLISAGLVGTIWFALRFLPTEDFWIYTFSVFIIGGLVVLFFIFFNIESIIPLARRLPFVNHFKRYVKDLVVLRRFTRRELGEILAWAAIRYLIYSTQYLLLLKFLGIETGILAGYACIAAIFLFQTSIPLPPVVGLVARGAVAIKMWSYFGANELSILAATFGLWIINLILPAFFGTFFIFRVNIAKTLGYGEDQNSTD